MVNVVSLDMVGQSLNLDPHGLMNAVTLAIDGLDR